MSEFGQQLRALRLGQGFRQADLADKLHGAVARSTLASVESGRTSPSPRLWAALENELPEWAACLEPAYASTQSYVAEPPADSPFAELAGPFVLVDARYVYVFREHRAPEEIIEVLRVRAMRDGADAYVLHLDGVSASGPEVEILWGGRITDAAPSHGDRKTSALHRIAFDHRLKKGELYSFAVRSWVAHVDTPPNCVGLCHTIPVSRASLQLNFFGPTPAKLWRFGPVVDGTLAEDPASAWAQHGPLEVQSGCVSACFENPRLNTEYGIAWQW
ncbi:helix-turn-helix protein [Propionicimonas paludicola]|uniref:Helix-turn-helix protein n=1 Tax=Propionicimonas paludicola TaxID=185243 RepID=A0A2A9CPP2_9ACTN|nr:helix-turn-helix transcriptional regulator [Propionicimonas paludicola]PFG15630.1 helix-turn-helix protein [Propionicimonas paludicola]